MAIGAPGRFALAIGAPGRFAVAIGTPGGCAVAKTSHQASLEAIGPSDGPPIPHTQACQASEGGPYRLDVPEMIGVSRTGVRLRPLSSLFPGDILAFELNYVSTYENFADLLSILEPCPPVPAIICLDQQLQSDVKGVGEVGSLLHGRAPHAVRRRRGRPERVVPVEFLVCS